VEALPRCLKKALRLRAGSTSAEPEPLPAPPENSEGKPLARILVADDNATNQKVCLAILEKLGYRADVVVNGMEALRALEAIPYDLVLMDLQMPEMDGLEATRLIRDPSSKVKDHRVPVVAVSAGNVDSDGLQCRQAGMDDFLQKPFEPHQLASTLERHIHARRENAPSEPAAKAPDDCAAEFPYFDRAELLRRVMGDREVADLVLQGYFNDLPRQIAELESAIEDGDAEKARRLAHSIKGASANVGADELRDVARHMEQIAATSTCDALAGLVLELEHTYAGVLSQAVGGPQTSEGCE
jgi:CheY-like chemotaxis protein/HPt (histidine-containing phosphotransfer) domain-containing protein